MTRVYACGRKTEKHAGRSSDHNETKLPYAFFILNNLNHNSFSKGSRIIMFGQFLIQECVVGISLLPLYSCPVHSG